MIGNNGRNGHDQTELKDKEEIRYAHDLLEACVSGEVPEMEEILGEQPKLVIRISRDVLCWVLGHSDDGTFADNLKQLATILDDLGYVRRYDA